MQSAFVVKPPFPGANLASRVVNLHMQEIQSALDADRVPDDAADVYKSYDGHSIYCGPDAPSIRTPTLLETHARVTRLLSKAEGDTLGDVVAHAEQTAHSARMRFDRLSSKWYGQPFFAAMAMVGALGGAVAIGATHGALLALAATVVAGAGFAASVVNWTAGEMACRRANRADDTATWARIWGGKLEEQGVVAPPPSFQDQLRTLPSDEKRRLAAQLIAQAEQAERPAATVERGEHIVKVGNVEIPVNRA